MMQSGAMQKRIAIAGAGSVGCYVGGALAMAGREVTLLARARLAHPIAQHGIRISDLSGLDRHVPPHLLRVTSDPAQALCGADIVLVTVKAFDTAAMADLIARHGVPQAIVVSLQNGAGNAQRLAQRLQ